MGVVFDTAPGFSGPSVPPVIDVPYARQGQRGGAEVKLPSGVTLPLPVRIWNTRALVLSGLADSKALDAALTKWRGRRVVTVRVNRNLDPDPQSSQSVVAIWAVDYEGCSIGPIKVVCAASWIERFIPGKWESYRFMWWHYYGNSPTNHEFKANVWGLKNELAAVETSYAGNWKSARYLQNGEPALTMAWDLSRVQDYDEGPLGSPEAHKFISVSQRKFDDGENEVWLRIRRLLNAQGGKLFPFDPCHDIFRIDPNCTLGRALGEVSFLPLTWEYLTNYSGIVWITQPDGRGAAPPWPDAPPEPKKPLARHRGSTKRRIRRYKSKS